MANSKPSIWPIQNQAYGQFKTKHLKLFKYGQFKTKHLKLFKYGQFKTNTKKIIILRIITYKSI